MSFGQSSRDDIKHQNNPLKVYMPKDYSKEGGENTGDISFTSSFRKASSPPSSPLSSTFGKSKREAINKQMNVLGVSRPADHSSYPIGPPQLKPEFLTVPRSPSTKFGKSKRDDLKKRANELRVYQPKDYSLVGDSINYDNLTTEMNARFRTPGRVCIGKAPKNDFIKMVNPLGVYLPRDLSDQHESKDAKAVYECDSRMRTPSSYKFSKSSRDDLKKQANVLGVYMSKDYSHMDDNTDPNKLVSPMDSRWRNQPRVQFGVSKRDDIRKQANTLSVPMVNNTTSTVDYSDSGISQFDSRFVTKGSAHFLHADRDAILMQNNALGTSLPRDYARMGQSDSVDTAALCRAIDQRYRNQPRVPMASSKRSDILIRANPLGVILPQDHSQATNTADPKKILTFTSSKFRRPPATKFGNSKREDKKFMANPLGTYMPKDYSHMEDNTDPDKVISPMDSRFRTAPKVSIGSSTREAYAKQSNLFGVVEMVSDCEGTYDVDKYHSMAAISLKKRNQKTKGFGTSKRDDLEKLNNPQNVPMPYSYTANVRYVEKPISKLDSRFKRAASAGFGHGNREDIILQANPLGATLPPRASIQKVNENRSKRRLSTSNSRRSTLTSSDGRLSQSRAGRVRLPSGDSQSKPSKNSTMNPKQQALLQIRHENARHKRHASRKKWAIILRARKNGSQWVKYFQNKYQRD